MSLMIPKYWYWDSSGNVSVEASQESIETDNHIHTDISENSDDSFHISQIESESNDERIQNSQCKNILTEKKYIVSLFTLKSMLVFG